MRQILRLLFQGCLVLLIVATSVTAQLSGASSMDPATLKALMAAQSGSGSAGMMSDAEMLYMQKMLQQERTGASKSGAMALQSGVLGANDSTSLLLPPDSVMLGGPGMRPDTMMVTSVLDTIPLDSVKLYEDIEELLEISSDGKGQIVRRKKLVPRQHQAKRYEQAIFETADPSIYASTTAGVNGDYPIKVGDALVLTLWGEVEKEYPLNVNNQGKVNVEGVGMVSLNNTNLAEAEAILKTKLAKIYSGVNRKATFVNLRLETLSPIKVFILGDVVKPGGYVFHGNTSVFQALYQAGGPNGKGSVRSIQVTREDTVFQIDLYQYLMFGKKTEPSVLLDGDVVFLPRASALVEAKGDVGRSAIYELKPGEGVTELLEFAGKINPTAADQGMVVERLFLGGRKDYVTIAPPKAYVTGGEKYPLQDGDVLQIFQSAEPSNVSVTILGSIKYPGTYQYLQGMLASDLVKVAGGPTEQSYEGRIQVLRPIAKGGYNLFSQSLAGQGIPLQPRDTLIVYSARDLYKPDSVTVGGAVVKPGAYEYYAGMTAKDLILLAGGFLPQREEGKLRLDRLNATGRGTHTQVLNIADNYEAEASGAAIPLKPWDHVEVPVNPDFHRPEKVVLYGAFRKPGTYNLLYPGEKVGELVARSGGFQDEAYLEGAQFYRHALVRDTLDTLGQIGLDLNKALKGEGRNNIQLRDGDSLYVPVLKVSVRVSGEVGFPTNVLWRKGRMADWYVSQAGGFNLFSDPERVMIKYANGSIVLASQADRDPDPGSEIIVPYKKPPEPVQWTQIVSAFGTVMTAIAAFVVAYAAYQN